MAKRAKPHKDLPAVYEAVTSFRLKRLRSSLMVGLALAMFIALFGFGDQLVGWHDPGGSIKLGLFMAFLFGIICGYRSSSRV